MSLATLAARGFATVLALCVGASGAVFFMARSSSNGLAHYKARTAALGTAVQDLRADFYNYDDQMNMYVAVLEAGRGRVTLANATYQQAFSARQAFASDLREATRLVGPGSQLTVLLQRAARDFAGYNKYSNSVRADGLADRTAAALYAQTVGNLAPSNDMMPTIDAASSYVRADEVHALSSLHTKQGLVEDVTLASALATTAFVIALGAILRSFVLRP
ncbi:MAG TPA: hypothetical protein VME46_23925, partial [Acidimicrobiales bacterium]|nr:hypothetical protein [Acidimicrobiales bacterium]